MRYFKDGTFADDPFAGAETLSGPDWLERRGSALPSPLVLQLDPGFDVEAIRGLREGRRVETIRGFYPPGVEPVGRAGTRPWARRSA